jgi:hypothetical protein
MIPLNQKVKIIFSNSANDEWGLPVKSPNFSTYKVRLDFNADAKLIQMADGKEVIFSATIYFKGSVPLTYEDYIEYDSGNFEGIVQKHPQVIFPITDLAGKVTYTKVIV